MCASPFRGASAGLLGALLVLSALPSPAQDSTGAGETKRRVVIHGERAGEDGEDKGLRIEIDRDDPGARIELERRGESTTRNADYVRFGEDVRVKADERIMGDVVVFGSDVVVEGSVHGDCVAVGGTIHLGENAYVSGDVVSVGGGVSLADSAEVSGDAVAVWGKLDVSPSARVYGEQEEVGGMKVDAPGFAWLGKGEEGFSNRLGSLIRRAVWAFVLLGMGVLLFSVFPSRMRRLAATSRERSLVAFVAGFAGWLAIIPFFVILLITIVGIPLALLMIPLTPTILLFGYLGVAHGVGRKLREMSGSKKFSLAATLLAGVMMLEGFLLAGHVVGLFGSGFRIFGGLLNLVGHAVIFIAVTIGFGSFLISRFRPEEPPLGVGGYGFAPDPPAPESAANPPSHGGVAGMGSMSKGFEAPPRNDP